MTTQRGNKADRAQLDANNRAQVAPESGGDRMRQQNDLLDEGLEETFPASDPISVVRLK